MWHVLRIEKHQIVQGTDDVVLNLAWIESAQRSWELEYAVAGYSKEHLDEYGKKLGGRNPYKYCSSCYRSQAPRLDPILGTKKCSRINISDTRPKEFTQPR
jgi:hypothetical protein